MSEIKGYKASNNRVCFNDFEYNVGETYTLNESPILCVRGFHFCLNPDDVLNHYNITDHDFVLFEIIAKGNTVHEYDSEKSCTTKIYIKRIIPKDEYNDVFKNHKFEFHENGRLKSIENKSQNTMSKFDEYGRLEFYQFNEVEYTKYDENGKSIEHRNSKGEILIRDKENGQWIEI
jgi:hypothetical protein